jgi:hypothetical protein
MLGGQTLDVEESPAEAAHLMWGDARRSGHVELHVREAIVFINPAAVAYVIEAGEPRLH